MANVSGIAMSDKIVYLKPEGPFHLQTGGGDHESVDNYPHSDTLSSAIIYWWLRQYGTIAGFPESLPYHHSSLFPAVKANGGITRLFPKPAGIDIAPESQSHKVFKKIKWVDQELFQMWRDGRAITGLIPENSESPYLRRNGEVWVSNTEQDIGTGPLTGTDVRTRAIVDRDSHATTPFHFVSAVYARDLLFWLYLSIHSEDEPRFMAVLRLLGDEGLGADRTIGMGRFSIVDIEPSDEVNGKDSGKWFNMGVFNPNSNVTSGVDWKESSYKLVTRGGWITGKSLRRQPVICVGENAAIASSRKPTGNILCVLDKDDTNIPEHVDKPEFSVYRDCRGYFLPCK